MHHSKSPYSSIRMFQGHLIQSDSDFCSTVFERSALYMYKFFKVCTPPPQKHTQTHTHKKPLKNIPALSLQYHNKLSHAGYLMTPLTTTKKATLLLTLRLKSNDLYNKLKYTNAASPRGVKKCPSTVCLCLSLKLFLSSINSPPFKVSSQ